jgi:hypothetical protein
LSVNNRTGRLSVTANQLGLFVFSVKVEEYRAGKRIGYALRDFQLKVVDCPINNAPISFAKLKGSSKKIGKDEIITIPNTQKNACFELFFTDLILTLNCVLKPLDRIFLIKVLPIFLLPIIFCPLLIR